MLGLKMKRTLFLSILIVFFTTSFLFLLGCNNQNIIKEPSSLSELQEQCVKRSKEFFSKEYGDGTVKTKDGTTTTHYSDHYNKKQKKCFLLLKSKHIFNDKKKGYKYSENLSDIDENQECGYFIIENDKNIVCFVFDKECKSKEGWDSLVKPYMEE
jgi:hypothetical protein